MTKDRPRLLIIAPAWSQGWWGGGKVPADLAAGRLRSRYDHVGHSDLVGLPRPRRDLLQVERYLTTNIVQTARGQANADSGVPEVRLREGVALSPSCRRSRPGGKRQE